METVASRFQGVRNIIAFNYPYYAFALFCIAASIILGVFQPDYGIYFTFFAFGLLLFLLLSLIASYYVYDVSPLYDLDWLQRLEILPNAKILNVHAGYDETSERIHRLFPFAELTVFDFFNPDTHTEPSIQRARKKYPSYPNTIHVNTTQLPISDAQENLIVVFLAAHEIRNEDERILFFRELRRSLAPTGRIIVTEHIRNVPNFFVYTIGSFHFFSFNTWLRTFEYAGFNILEQFYITPFVRTFILEKHDNTP